MDFSIFTLNLRYSFKRLFADKAVWLLVIVPMALIVINAVVEDPFVFGDYNVTASTTMPIFLLAFQFFNMGIMLHYLYHDLKGDMRWRLRATPNSTLSYVLPAFTASWLFSVLLGLVIVAASVLFLGAYLGSLLVTLVVLLLVSLFASFLAMLLFLFIEKFSLANTLVYVISFALMILSGMFFSLGDGAFGDFFSQYGTPLVLGQHAIIYAGGLSDIMLTDLAGTANGTVAVWTNIGILAVATAVLAAITLLVARGRRI